MSTCINNFAIGSLSRKFIQSQLSLILLQLFIKWTAIEQRFLNLKKFLAIIKTLWKLYKNIYTFTPSQTTGLSWKGGHILNEAVSHAMQGRLRWVIVNSSDKNVVCWRREWQTNPVFLPQEPHEKAKRYETGKMRPQVRRCPICYWGGAEGSYSLAPERMKPLGQSANDAQLQTCLVMKIKSDAVENNIALLFSLSVVSDYLQSHEWQHTRLPGPSLSPGVYSNTCLLSW